MTGRPPWRLVLISAVTAAFFAGAIHAQRPEPAGAPNFDIRTQKDRSAKAYRSRVMANAAPAQVSRSLARLNGLDVIRNRTLGTPEVVSVKAGTGFLTGPSTDRAGTLRRFLTANALAFGVTDTQVVSLELVADYANPAGNMAWVELQQKVKGIPVFQGLIRGAFTAQGELARTTGLLAADLNAANLGTAAVLSAPQAVARAAASVGWAQTPNALVERGAVDGKITVSRGTMARDAKAWQVYFPMAPGVARLAWVTEIWGDPIVFMVVLDAEDGTVLFRKNLTSYQTQPASYTVFASDSPAPMSPVIMLPGSGTQAPYVVRTTLSLIGNEAPNTFNNSGWMADNTNGVNGWTEGNNVRAGVDNLAPDGIDVLTSGSARAFTFTYDPSVNSPTISGYRNGAVTNLFYWANVHHDKLYLLGFTESAGNFQHDNFARGGLSGDRVNAEADYTALNSASFSTPSDGTFGRLQMYVFNGPTPDRSSSLDQELLLHELTHGTSSRLHANATGLTTTMAAGMGEGWSDFYARALLSTAAEDVNAIYSHGGWIGNSFVPGFTDNYYYGMRSFPYAVMANRGINGKPHNPLTFADVDADSINKIDGAYPPSPAVPNDAYEVHNIGEVWAMALLEVRARFITRLGYATGHQRILQFVTDGMKLDPSSPTMLEGRDSIIAAANAGGGTMDDIADIWAGFAVRGMGVSAQVLDVDAGVVVEGFDVPGPLAGEGLVTGESIPNNRIDPGESVTVSLCIFNNRVSPSGSVAGTLQATGGVMSPSGTQSYGVIPGNATVCRSYAFIANASCSATVTATLAMTESGGASKNLAYAFQVGSPVVFFSENFDGVAAPALPAGWSTSKLAGVSNLWVTSQTESDSAPNGVFTTNPEFVSDNVLVSPSIAIPAGGAVLTFRNWYNTEPGFDGGVLEIQIGAGSWTDIVTAGGSIVTGGYTGTIPASYGNPLANRQAWTGNSRGYITTTVNMPPGSASQSIKLRWRMGSDDSFEDTGWFIDSVSLRLTAFECSPPPPPGVFGKSQPGNGATSQPSSPVLSWGTASGATDYEYCLDTSNNGVCDTSWTSTGNTTSIAVTGLSASTPYSWHVRAVNGAGATYAESAQAAFWTFTTGVPSPPFGQVDTPVQNAAGVQGAIGVTGWALDDVGVTTVEIFRNCLAFEPGNCQTVLGNSVVYIGEAAFLPGARPDVEAAFPTYPLNNRAGWGYLMLTPMLPHVPGSQPFGGQGALTLYAIATDTNGNRRILGRSSDPNDPTYSTPTGITMTNDAIAKPFGAIDTPGQGATIGGIFNNFGWAITPDNNPTGGDPDDILIPTNGSTMTVFIDGNPTALVAYKQCRGSVGNPVPAGIYCNDDVSNIFGNPTPQPPLTTRTANSTKFRNLDAQRAAIGAYTFNTASLSNGLHTIAWSVTDSAGRTEGIGSRFFNVLNGSPDAPLRLNPPATLANAAPATAGVFVRSGFDLAEAWRPLAAKDDKTFAVRLQELGRLELWLGLPVDAGYVVANGTLRPLPVGSSLREMRFAWMPPAGYVGSYKLVFVRGSERITVTVTIAPKG